MSDGSVTINFDGDTKELEKDIKSVGDKVKSGFSKIGSIAGTAIQGVSVAVGAAATAVTGLVTASVNAYAEYEQLVGGVDTLFKNSSQKLQAYADEAYKTAGLSANEYMSTVTGFSASLLQSLSGDTEKAADYANQALIDMSDNANKMGTSMESIQYAYQGFAKQNYTMLDNLKLGYGGTKEEMERLLADAQKLTGIKYDISSFADVTQAIHAIQTELGITGTTAKEANSTIEGSFNSMKAAWNNLLVGITNPDADWEKLIQNLVDTVTTAGENLLPAIGSALVGVTALIRDLFPSIAQEIPNLINELLPQLVQAGVGIIQNLLLGMQQNLPQLIETTMQVITTLLQTILTMLPQILEMGIQIIVELIKGIAQQAPTLVPQIVDCIILIVETLIDNLDMIIEAGIELIIALIEGIFNALPDLIAKLPELILKILTALLKLIVVQIPQAGVKIVKSLIDGLFSYAGSMINKVKDFFKGTIFETLINKVTDIMSVGVNIVKGIWDGISGMASWLWNKISGWCSDIFNNIKNFFGIHSPSRLFADEVGKMLGLGVGEGFNDSLDSVYKDMEKAINYENDKLTSNLTNTQQIKTQIEDDRQIRLQSLDDNKDITVNTVTNLDGKVLATSTNKVNTKRKLQYGY